MRPAVIGLLSELDIHTVEASPQDPRPWTIRGEPLTDEQLAVICDADGEEFAEAFRLVERAAVLAREACRQLDAFVAELGDVVETSRVLPVDGLRPARSVDLATVLDAARRGSA